MKLKEKIKQTVSDIFDEILEEEAMEWPPGCVRFSFQPERPYSEKEKQKQKEFNYD